MMSLMWQSSKTLAERHLYLFQNEIETDVEFLAGDEEKETVRAHRIILASRSPVFHAMFYGDMREQGNVISLPDITPDSLKCFITYLYTDTATLNESNIMDILNAAKKYCIDNLVEVCEKYLCSCLATENIAVWIEASTQFDLAHLWQECIQFIVRHSSIIFSGDCLSDLKVFSLEKMLASENLAVCEYTVFKWLAERWSAAECNRQGIEHTSTNMRKVLNNMLYKVRFPLMPLDYFTSRVVDVEKELLTEEEIVDVKKSIIDPSRDPQYFQNHLRKNIFDALGWGTFYPHDEKSGALGFSLSTNEKRTITLKSVIIKAFKPKHAITIESDKEDYFGSSSTTQTFYVTLEKGQLNKFVNIILPGDGVIFRTRTRVTCTPERSEIRNATGHLTASHILENAATAEELCTYYFAIQQRKQLVKTCVNIIQPPNSSSGANMPVFGFSNLVYSSSDANMFGLAFSSHTV